MPPPGATSPREILQKMHLLCTSAGSVRYRKTSAFAEEGSAPGSPPGCAIAQRLIALQHRRMIVFRIVFMIL